MSRRKSRVIALDIGCVPDAADCGPRLLMSDRAAFLVFGTSRDEGHGRAIVEIKGCTLVRFGYPGEQALAGHPLHAKGMGRFGVYEALDSTWLNQLSKQHDAAKTGQPFAMGLRHFVFTFRDSTLECIAEDLVVMCTRERTEEIIARLAPMITTTLV